MKKRIACIFGVAAGIWLLQGMLVLADELPELEASEIAGYYYTADESILFLANGLAYTGFDSELRAAKTEIDVYGDSDNFIITSQKYNQSLYFSRQTEKDGVYFAIYNEYIGSVGEADFKEGKHIIVGDYIFGNDYEVAQQSPLFDFFGIESADMSESGNVEGTGFASPEEAVTGFIGGLQKHNVKQMEAAFAVETYAENYDLEKMIEGIAAYTNSLGFVPNTSEFAIEINTGKRQEMVLDQIRNLYLTLIKAKTHYGERTEYAVPYHSSETSMDEFMEETFPDNDRAFEVIFEGKFISPEAVAQNYSSEKVQENMKNQSSYFKSDEIKSMVVLLEIDSEKYLLCMDVVLYGDKWYICNLSGTIGAVMGISRKNAGLYLMEDDEYSEILKYIE